MLAEESISDVYLIQKDSILKQKFKLLVKPTYRIGLEVSYAQHLGYVDRVPYRIGHTEQGVSQP